MLPFHNVYATAPVTIGGEAPVRINAHKTLHGRDLADGEFHFAVRDAKGNVIATASNDANGNVDFTPIEFTPSALPTTCRTASPFAMSITRRRRR